MSDQVFVCRRDPTVFRSGRGTTFGRLYLPDDAYFCFTLEDAIREEPGWPVERWKIKGQTAIPVGRYRMTLEHSPRFGPDTITLHDVPGFVGVRVHGGNDADDTEGCPLVGDSINRDLLTISGARVRGVLDALKAHVREAMAIGPTYWEVVNPS